MAKRRPNRSRKKERGWDPLAAWYDGWVGKDGSHHHQKLAVPAVLDLLEIQGGEAVLDIGAGQGVMAPYVAQKGGAYTGVDISRRLIQFAKERHSRAGKFLVGDARNLAGVSGLGPDTFDAAILLLSIQDIQPFEDVFESAHWVLKPSGRLVLLMTHPAFRVPRQSGWGWDTGRKLRYRRIDRYLTPLGVPMKKYPGSAGGTSTSFHRPIRDYVNTLGEAGFLIDKMLEIPTYKRSAPGPRAKAENLSNEEIPLFLGLRAWNAERYDQRQPEET